MYRLPTALTNFALVSLVVVCCTVSSLVKAEPERERIDRHALVTRHDMKFDRYMPQSPGALGNGEFAFNFDITGLQTFPSEAAGHIPLGTMAQWGWHTFPSSKKFRYEQTLVEYDIHGRQVSYATDRQSEAAQAIRANPHRFNLAQIGLKLLSDDGRPATADDLTDTTQIIRLWTGHAESNFTFAGKAVRVQTVVDPQQDTIAVSIESPLLETGQLAVEIRFAYPAGIWGPRVDDWTQSSRHQTTLEERKEQFLLSRQLDDTVYQVAISTNGRLQQEAPHTFSVTSQQEDGLNVVASFTPEDNPQQSITFDQVKSRAAAAWEAFWSSGGAIDLSGSTDSRWRELERRIVQSQFLTAIHCAGSMPPQETGLVCNSWFGKSHLEMHWWHAAHFPLWGRHQLLERSMAWYDRILPAAKRIAQRQGYGGVRWPKMTGPAGVSSPSDVGELLIWQQPHPIYFAEQAYRVQPNRETLDRYRSIVEETAQFMADYAHLDQESERYMLGPVLIPAQECYNGRSSPGALNPTFELAYWRWSLQTANQWRERLGLPANQQWAEVAAKISPPPIRDGIYTAIESSPFLRRHDHPSMLAALGVLPDVGLIEPRTMHATLNSVQADWDWASTWGWDYPMMAMTAARLGERKQAVDLLLLDSPKNHYLPNGHCRQADRLPVYLPANGGLLIAVAMMAEGWDGVESGDSAPGFPNDGSWNVRHEGLLRMP